MTDRQTVKRLATAIAAGGVFAIAPVAIPAASAQPADCPNYAVQATTTTSITVSPSTPAVGDAFTATASVLTSGGVPVNGGVVTFTYAGQTARDVVNAGQASATFTAEQGRFTLSANYAGQCLAGGAAVDPSTDTQPIVAGVEAFGGNGGGNGSSSSGNGGGAARPAATIAGVSGGSGSGSSSTVGGLASTGVDSQTELYGLLGLGLVTVGGLTLLVHRRRVQG
jgi:LPXTG-motif cell wall-anchored protein